MDEPVEAVLFDVDGTLCEYRRSGAELLAAAFEHEGVEPFFRVKAYYDRFEKFAAHHDGIDDLRAACFAAIAADRGRDRAIGHALAGHYAAARDHGEVRYLPDAREAIDALADEHRLGVVTNGRPNTQKPKLAALGLTDAFGTVVYAGHDVTPKPDPRRFTARWTIWVPDRSGRSTSGTRSTPMSLEHTPRASGRCGCRTTPGPSRWRVQTTDAPTTFSTRSKN
jgi:putative hydrolase of the HAD superfamily